MTNDKLHNMRHTLAHILAEAVLELFPSVKLGIGPVIDEGFYYDFDLGGKTFSELDLAKIEKKMKKIVAEGQTMDGYDLAVDAAIEYLKKKDQPYKQELAEQFKSEGEKKVSFYTLMDKKGLRKFKDLCRGGHVKTTKEVGAFKLMKTAGAYWRGDSNRPMLQRIYGTAFETEQELNEYLTRMEEAKKRDHKRLGVEMDLFTFSDLVGAGLPLWTPKGTLVRNILDEFVWSLRKARGYQKVEIPHITKKDLYQKSGHWDKYQDDLFKIVTREKHEFAMKPMNCPHHTQIFSRKQHSYRELPQRYANTTMVYRDEQTGELQGLSRVRSITQDDAHVFCRVDQVQDEILKIWDIVYEFYKAVGFELTVRLSLHDPKQPEKYLGTPEVWKKSEEILRQIAKTKKANATEAPGEAAFYGPKIDFLAHDSIGRQWQIATIQLDMNMPERFDLTCVNEKSEKERIVMLHAAIMGSIERYMSILIEHFAGAFPVWLSPVQIQVIPVSKDYNEYAKNLATEFTSAGFRVELDEANESVGYKIRRAEKSKVPYMLVIGEKEMQSPDLNVRRRGNKDVDVISKEAFIKQVTMEMNNKTL